MEAVPLVSGMASPSSQGMAVPLLASTGQGNTGTVPPTIAITNQGITASTSPQGELADALLDIREDLEDLLVQMQDGCKDTTSRKQSLR